MDENCAIARYELACRLLPPRLQTAARHLPDHQKAYAEELRLRTGQYLTVLLPEGEVRVDASAALPVKHNDIEQLCDTVTGYSRYAVAETMSHGYITAPGGFRIGLCGSAVMKNGENCNLRELSSAVIRISREKLHLSDVLVPKLFIDHHFESTLLAAPPGLGKTTLLRDLIRCLSDGTQDEAALRVAVVDERGEIAGTFRGEPQLTVGCHTDVLDGCLKQLGIEMVLRSLNPQVIAVDEITAPGDIRAMAAAANCGVSLIATIHAADREDLRRKPLFQQLQKQRVFRNLIVIERDGQGRRYRVESL